MTVTPPNVPVHLSPEEVAKLLGLARNTIYNWIYLGTAPPYVKIGNSIRFPANELVDWIEARTHRKGDDK